MPCSSQPASLKRDRKLEMNFLNTNTRSVVAPTQKRLFARDLLKDSGVTGHVSTSLQHKNMQSNKHVLIHNSKFKNTSVVLVLFLLCG